jgi:hypothetical protein
MRGVRIRVVVVKMEATFIICFERPDEFFVAAVEPVVHFLIDVADLHQIMKPN